MAQSRLEQWTREAGDPASRLADAFAEAFSLGLPLSVGLEEELILVDAQSLLPVDAVESVLARVVHHPTGLGRLRAARRHLRGLSQVQQRTELQMRDRLQEAEG